MKRNDTRKYTNGNKFRCSWRDTLKGNLAMLAIKLIAYVEIDVHPDTKDDEDREEVNASELRLIESQVPSGFLTFARGHDQDSKIPLVCVSYGY